MRGYKQGNVHMLLQVPDEAATAKKQAEADEKAKAEGKEAGEKVEPVTKSEAETKWDWAVQNDSKPLWTRRPREVSQEEYDAFYKTTFKEFMEPCAHSHFNVEGQIEFTGLLYVPGMAPFDQQVPAVSFGKLLPKKTDMHQSKQEDKSI